MTGAGWQQRFGAAVLGLALLLSGGTASAQEVRDARAETGESRQTTREPLAGASGTPAYHLQAGDQVQIRVFGHPELTGDFTVTPRGRITFPLIGAIHLADRTAEAAAAALTDRLKPDYLRQPQVSVQLLNPRPIYVLGEVETPGSYPYRSGMTVSGAVALAGGFTYRADGDDLAITRAHRPKAARLRAAPESRVLPGDTIHVESSLF